MATHSLPSQPASEGFQHGVSTSSQQYPPHLIHIQNQNSEKTSRENSSLNGAGQGIEASEQPKNNSNILEQNSRDIPVQHQNWTHSEQQAMQTYEFHQQQQGNQSYHHQESAKLAAPGLMVDMTNGLLHSQRNPSFFETLAAEADAQDRNRFRILHGNGKEKGTNHDDFKPLSCDSTMDATGKFCLIACISHSST